MKTIQIAGFVKASYQPDIRQGSPVVIMIRRYLHRRSALQKSRKKSCADSDYTEYRKKTAFCFLPTDEN